MDDAEWIASLERENIALRATNAKLARDRLGAANTAAATALAGAGASRGSLIRRGLSPLRRLRLLLRRVALRLLR
jgi:hypothetical protein